MTRHDWVFEVLTDLASFAEANGMPELARKAREALDVAREEMAEAGDPPEGGDGGAALH